LTTIRVVAHYLGVAARVLVGHTGRSSRRATMIDASSIRESIQLRVTSPVDHEPAKYPMDDLLVAFVAASAEAESQAVLEDLICNHAQPLIKNIVRFKLKAYSPYGSLNLDQQEVDDISGEVIVRLVDTLRLCKSAPREKSIASLRSYVATMAYNASDQYLRHKYPRRFSLKNKVRYILTHDPRLALWESDRSEPLCGLSSRPRVRKAGSSSFSRDENREELHKFLLKRFAGRIFDRVNPADLTHAVLEFTGAPVEIDDLVTVMADVLAIRDPHPRTSTQDEAERLSSDPRTAMDGAFDDKQRLGMVWAEITQLPPRQRAALLLNLRDERGEPAIVWLPMLRIASIEQIAAALEMAAEDLAAIWNDLPLDDATIAVRLGASRQQVSNLRKCARERLSRRLMGQRKQ